MEWPRIKECRESPKHGVDTERSNEEWDEYGRGSYVEHQEFAP